MSRSTTVGGHVELGSRFENAGTTFDNAGRLGIAHLSIAQSRDRRVSGLAGTVSDTLDIGNVWSTVSLFAATSNYSTLAQRAFADPTVLQEQIDIGVRPFPANYTSNISYSNSRSRLGHFNRLLSWQHTLSLTRGVTLLVSTGVSASQTGRYPNIFVSLIRSFGRNSRNTTVLSLEGNGGALEPTLEVQRATPVAGGTGYDANFYNSGSTLSTGTYALRSPIGNLDVNYGLARDRTWSGDLALSGAVAFVGNYVHLSQPISDGFALVKVNGGEPVKVLMDNQDAGMTDRNGFLVLPNLRSYYDERVGVVRDDGPVNLDVSGKEQRIVVASRRGVVTNFTASVVRAIIGKVTVSDKGRNSKPAFGLLSLTSSKGSASSDLDINGRFYFEDMAAGTYEASILYAGGKCSFTLLIPQTTAIEKDIGTFTCVHS